MTNWLAIENFGVLGDYNRAREFHVERRLDVIPLRGTFEERSAHFFDRGVEAALRADTERTNRGQQLFFAGSGQLWGISDFHESRCRFPAL